LWPFPAKATSIPVAQGLANNLSRHLPWGIAMIYSSAKGEAIIVKAAHAGENVFS